MNEDPPVTVICRYCVKPGHEAEMERLLAQHWPALKGQGLVTDEPPAIYRGCPSPKPGGENDLNSVYIEIFSWKSQSAPQTAHELPEVMAVWEPMGAICESMEFPSFEPLDLVTV